MTFYQEITLFTDTDIPPFFLWQKVYMQVHLALADNKTTEGVSAIGVSFPEYDVKQNSLGTKLRIFASTHDELRDLKLTQWLDRFIEYVTVSEIARVPDGINRHARFTRYRPITNRERLARRRAKRHNESFENALTYYDGFTEKFSGLPFLKMDSLSNDRRFKLFIAKETMGNSLQGTFSCYGLSQVATVPDF